MDTPPEMRIAAIANKIEHIEAIVYTHSHADHIFGMDDVRPFNYKQGGAMQVYAEQEVQDDIRRIFGYAFRSGPIAGGRPQIQLSMVRPQEPLEIADTAVTPLRVYHGALPILAYKFGKNFAYVTDVNRIPDETIPYLMNLDVLMLDAVRIEKHETHFNLEEALAAINVLKPRQTYLTHLSHDFDYTKTNASLPSGVKLTYDGHVFDVADD